MSANRKLMTLLILGTLIWLGLWALTIGSFWFSVSWRDQSRTARFWIGDGAVRMTTERLAGPGFPNPTWRAPPARGWSLERRHFGVRWSDFCPFKRYPYWGGTLLSLPLWIPLVLLGAALRYARGRLIRRFLPHHCRCGYDLTGNVTGRCPECGTPTAGRTGSDQPAEHEPA